MFRVGLEKLMRISKSFSKINELNKIALNGFWLNIELYK